MNDMKAAMPLNEIARLEELRALGILDTSPEKTYQFFTAMACMVFSTPIAAIGLMDSDRQWFKAKLGIEQHQWKRDETVCSHTLLQDQLLEIPDISKDKRFKGLEQFKFYAGVPLISSK